MTSMDTFNKEILDKELYLINALLGAIPKDCPMLMYYGEKEAVRKDLTDKIESEVHERYISKDKEEI